MIPHVDRVPWALETDAFLDCLVTCNQAIAAFLGMLCIDSARGYEAASATLKARNEPVPLWEQTAEELLVAPTYLDWLYHLGRRFIDCQYPTAKQGSRNRKEAVSSRQRAHAILGAVLWRAYRSVVGRAVLCPPVLAERRRKHPSCSWLDVGLDFIRSEVGNEIREAQTGIRRQRKQAKATAESESPQRQQPVQILPASVVVAAGTETARLPEPTTGPNDTPEANATRNEERRRVLAALTRLPEECRQILHERFFDGFTLEEIAMSWGLSVHRVRTLLEEAKAKLALEIARLRRQESSVEQS